MTRKLVASGCSGCGDGGPRPGPRRSIRSRPARPGRICCPAHSRGIRAVVAAKGDVKTLEIPAKAMARWITQFPTQFPQGQRAGPQHQGAAGGLVRQRGLPEGRGRPGRRVDQAGGARQGRRRRRAWRRRSRSWGTPARRATRTIGRAEQRPAPRPDPGRQRPTQGQEAVTIRPAPACPAWRRCTARARTPACPTPASRCSHRPAAPAGARRPAGRSGFPARAAAAARSRSR